MRLMLTIALFGALAMSTAAIADDPKSPADPKSYTEKGIVRKLNGKQFLNPVKDQPVLRGEIEGKKVIYTIPAADNVKTPKGSEITIGEETWVVDKVTELSTHHINYVTLKPKGK